jgi:hypothetical protein
MIFGYRDQRIHLKAPYLGPKMVEEIVSAVLVEKPVFEAVKIHGVTAEDMFRFALANYGGDFSYKKIWRAFRNQGVTTAEVRRAALEYEVESAMDVPSEKQIKLDGQIYALLKGDGRRPRQLEVCCLLSEDSQPGGYPEIQEIPESLKPELAPESIPFSIADMPLGGNGAGADDDEGAMVMGGLDLDSNGAVDDNCEACRMLNQGRCPGTCETIRRLNQ